MEEADAEVPTCWAIRAFVVVQAQSPPAQALTSILHPYFLHALQFIPPSLSLSLSLSPPLLLIGEILSSATLLLQNNLSTVPSSVSKYPITRICKKNNPFISWFIGSLLGLVWVWFLQQWVVNSTCLTKVVCGVWFWLFV